MASLGKQFRYLFRSADNIAMEKYGHLMASLGLTPNQSEVLLILNEYAPLSLKALGELLICEKKSPSRLVKSLIQKGLVTKEISKEDRRSALLFLTEAGRHLIPKIEQQEQLFDQSMEQAYPQELKIINDLLTKYIQGSFYEDKLKRRSLWDEE
ncbi:MarR family winged helix-turn-helix transcriptional regulator [Streptococcus macacae]|uniref:Transcriptional regulator, MarR family n=1 Tax=Streptococcus macacae NCTC 11558 TaxID=764298 RepID=G5JX60_9STRE|nr:winged helix DNA-binding protein [Streptococcus macacae]EHJ52020.1 transcriptional regulator, MarR family [Streptococcus macacae NCTC 11558]SUN77833.1 MarR family transcriptional regulator [Streptococcus macacae NCTC 11558]